MAVSGGRSGNSEQMLKGEMLYFGRQVGVCEIPDSTVRGRPAQGHVFLGFSPNVFLGLSPKVGLEKTLPSVVFIPSSEPPASGIEGKMTST